MIAGRFLRECIRQLLPWILTQPLEEILMPWEYFRPSERVQIFSITTLRRIRGSIFNYELPIVSPLVEELTVDVIFDCLIHVSHFSHLRKLSISAYTLTTNMIDEIVKLNSLIYLRLHIRPFDNGISARQLEPLLSHPNKDRLYCQMYAEEILPPKPIAELYTILQQRA